MIIDSKYLDKYDIRNETSLHILRCLLLLRNYTDRIKNDTDDTLLLSNGYSKISIDYDYSKIWGNSCSLTEMYDDPLIQNIGTIRESFYSGDPPIFKQIYSFDGKFVIISVPQPVRKSTIAGDYVKYNTKLLLNVAYYDKFNNDYLKDGNIKLDDIWYSNGVSKYVLPDSNYQYLIHEDIKYIYEMFGPETLHDFYSEALTKYETQTINALRVAYGKAEELLGVSLQGGSIDITVGSKKPKVKGKRNS